MPTFSPFFALSLRGLVFLLFALPGKNQATAALYSQPEISPEEAHFCLAAPVWNILVYIHRNAEFQGCKRNSLPG